MKITEYNIFFKIKNEILFGACIRANHEKTELFYHYPFGSNVESEIENLETGIIDEGYFPDHVSFHTDGKIHAKARDERKRKFYFNDLDAEMNIFNLEKVHYLPFFLESINISDEKYIEKRFKKNVTYNPERDILYDVTNHNSFSLLLISKCERLNPENMVKNEHLENLTIIGADVIQSVFEKAHKEKNFDVKSDFNTDLVIILVENVWDEFPKTIHHINNDEGVAFTTTVCLPPIELLGKMINLNNDKLRRF